MMSDEQEALVHAHDAVMVPGMESTPGPADGSALDKKSAKKKAKNSPASALAALGYRPSPAKPISSPPRKGSFVTQLAAAATGAPLETGSGGGIGTPFASLGVQGIVALAADAAAAAVGVGHPTGPGLEGVGGVSSGRSSSVGSEHPSMASQGSKHRRMKRVGSVTFGGVDVAGGGSGDLASLSLLVPPLLLPSGKENQSNLSLTTEEKGGVSAATSLKLKRKPSAQGTGLDEGQLPQQQQQQLVAGSSKSMRNLFGGLVLNRATSIRNTNNQVGVAVVQTW